MKKRMRKDMCNTANDRIIRRMSVLLPIILSALFLTVSLSAAAVFNVQTIVCTPSWYCTEFSGGTCGTRTCVDSEGCGLNRPVEYIKCKRSDGGGGSGGYNAYNTSASLNNTQDMLPEGYFTLNIDTIKATIEQGVVVQKIILINSSKSYDYFLEIQYSPSYTGGTEFISTTEDKKYIESIGDFNIIIDTRDIAVGTYVVPVKIYNKDSSKTVRLAIDVTPVDNPEMELSIDSKVKTVGIDDNIAAYLKVKGINPYSNKTITYSILDPKGNTIYSEDSRVDDLSNVEQTINIPKDMGEGYYTLSVKINSDDKTYIKSEQFIMLEPNKYAPIVQEPNRKLGLLVWILIIIASVVTLFNTGLFYKSSISRRHKRIRSPVIRHYMNTPRISIGQRIKNLTEIMKKKGEMTDEQKQDILKKSYIRGFISLKEYHDAAKAYGYNISASPAEEKKLENVGQEQKIMPIQTHIMQKAPTATNIENLTTTPTEKIKKDIGEKIPPKAEKHEEKLSEKKDEESLAKVKSVFETLQSERNLSEASIIGSLVHMFTQSILDRKTDYDHTFVLNNNERLYSMRELLDALPHMSESTFNHHTAHGRNDFSNWIGDVFRYNDIAEEIRNIKTKYELIEILKKYEDKV